MNQLKFFMDIKESVEMSLYEVVVLTSAANTSPVLLDSQTSMCVCVFVFD